MPTINDVAYDGGTVEIQWGSAAYGLNKISFGQKLESEKLRRIGSQSIDADTEGTYDTDDVAVTMEVGEWGRLLAALPANGYGRARFPILINYLHPDLGSQKVELQRCKILSDKDSIEASAAGSMVELTLRTMQIVRNGKTLNKRKGTSTTAANNLLKL